MTGQHFYDKFVGELPHALESGSWGDQNHFDLAVEAAKKAAGLE